jgi:hypothetical protein
MSVFIRILRPPSPVIANHFRPACFGVRTDDYDTNFFFYVIAQRLTSLGSIGKMPSDTLSNVIAGVAHERRFSAEVKPALARLPL